MLEFGNIIIRDKKIKDVKAIIYSGGKTASSTLYASFNNIIPTLQLHNNDCLKNFYKLNDVKIWKIINYHYLIGSKLLITSCYREPISRTISSFFQGIE